MGWTVQLRILFALLATLIGADMLSPAHAAGLPIAVCMAPAIPGTTARAAFTGSARYDCTRPQHHWRSGNFWVLSAPLPSLAGRRDLNIRFASLWQKRIDLFILYGDGTILRRGFTSGTAGRHLQLGAILSLPIPYRAAAPPVR
ncbi:MAG: hypothetical protein EOP89_17960, partial [Lysobacteraceae bacterium]